MTNHKGHKQDAAEDSGAPRGIERVTNCVTGYFRRYMWCHNNEPISMWRGQRDRKQDERNQELRNEKTEEAREEEWRKGGGVEIFGRQN